jgi:NADPH:quinone reductase-like Zn-dependent oxidoreductase
VINVVGFVGGGGNERQPGILESLSHICVVRGVQVGSRGMMEDMIRAIEANDIHPVVDEKVFNLDQARDAFEYLVSVVVYAT